MQLWTNLGYRYQALGTEFFPSPEPIWAGGVLNSVSDNGNGTMTVSMTVTSEQGWGVDPESTCSSPRWVDYVCTGCGLNFIPSTYDLVITPTTSNVLNIDPLMVVRGTVTAQSGTSGACTLTITSQGILNAVTAKFIPSVSSLAGSTYYLMRKGGYFWSDRAPDKPNDTELWIGSSCTGGTGTYPGNTSDKTVYSYLTDTTANFEAAWTTSSTDVLFFDGGGNLQRQTIKYVAGNTLYFPVISATAQGKYVVAATASRVMPGRAKWQPYQWYGGITDDYYSHQPDDTLGSAGIPALTFGWNEGNPCEDNSPCTEVDHTVFDVDAQIELENICMGSESGTFVSRDYNKSLRALQTDLLGVCSQFIPAKSYTGATTIPYYTPATFLQAIGENAYTSSLVYNSSSSSFSFAANSALNGYSVYWTILNPDGSVENDGQTTVVAGQVGVSASYPGDVGKTVVYSPGFTRYKPRRVRYMYPKTCFIPSCSETGCPDPPQVNLAKDSNGNTLTTYDCSTAGSWQTRGASTCYLDHNEYGDVSETVPFVSGDLVRYVGDNFADPTVYPLVMPGEGFPEETLVPYYDHFYRGKYGPKLQLLRDASRAGSVTSATYYSITDANQNWWSDGINGVLVNKASGALTVTTASNLTANPPVVGVATVPITPPYSPIGVNYVVTNSSGASVLTEWARFLLPVHQQP